MISVRIEALIDGSEAQLDTGGTVSVLSQSVIGCARDCPVLYVSMGRIPICVETERKILRIVGEAGISFAAVLLHKAVEQLWDRRRESSARLSSSILRKLPLGVTCCCGRCSSSESATGEFVAWRDSI